MLIEHKQITKRQAKTRGHNILAEAREKPQCQENPLIKFSYYSSNSTERESTIYSSQQDALASKVNVGQTKKSTSNEARSNPDKLDL